MRSNRGRHCLGPILLVLILSSAVRSASADPIALPGYTLTDLGAGTPTFSAAANGSGVLLAPNGQTYAFPQTPNTVLTSGSGMMANFPLIQAAPVNGEGTIGNPNYAFSYVSDATMNSNGAVAAIDTYGVYGHLYNGQVYVVQHNADGSWGLPINVFQGSTQVDSGGGGSRGFDIVGLSKSNEILINNYSSTSQANAAILYNINTHISTDLWALLSSANAGFINVVPLAIGDQGQIVLEAQPEANESDPRHTLLLTPNGVSALPLEVPAPEPSTLALMLLTLAGFAGRRLRASRRGS